MFYRQKYIVFSFRCLFRENPCIFRKVRRNCQTLHLPRRVNFPIISRDTTETVGKHKPFQMSISEIKQTARRRRGERHRLGWGRRAGGTGKPGRMTQPASPLPPPPPPPRRQRPVATRELSAGRCPPGSRRPRGTRLPPHPGLSRSGDGSQGSRQGAHSPASPVERSAASPARPPFRESWLGGAPSERPPEWPGAPRAGRAAWVPEAGAA